MSAPLPLPECLALRVPAPCVCTDEPLCNQHKAIADAIRAALDEAARVAQQEACATRCMHDECTGVRRAAAAIKALKG